LTTLKEDHKRFVEDYLGDTKKAKFCHNVISPSIFSVPIDQVYYSLKFSLAYTEVLQNTQISLAKTYSI